MAVALSAAATTFACGATTDAPASPSRLGATLNLMIKDSPFSDARSLLVTFSEVTAHRTEQAWTTLPFAGGATSRTCDLKKLTDAQDVLGTGPLAAGQYTQVRLVVSRAALYFDNAADGPPCAASIPEPAGRSAPIEIPSGEVKLIRPFQIGESGATTMLIDFDGDRSVRQTGSGRYMMTPVVTVVSVN
jgi:hypothetical protein